MIIMITQGWMGVQNLPKIDHMISARSLRQKVTLLNLRSGRFLTKPGHRHVLLSKDYLLSLTSWMEVLFLKNDHLLHYDPTFHNNKIKSFFSRIKTDSSIIYQQQQKHQQGENDIKDLARLSTRGAESYIS